MADAGGRIGTAPRVLLLLLAVAALLSGLAGGLHRAGVAVPAPGGPGVAALQHAMLMIGGFLGTVIGLERAVAVAHPAAFVGPLASGIAAIALLAGAPQPAAALLVVAALWLLGASVVVLRRQPASFNRLLIVASLCWLVGALGFAAGAPIDVVLVWGFDFLVLTVVAERLEMTRLMRREPWAAPVLWIAVAIVVAGSALAFVRLQPGALVWGVGIALAAAWLLRFDLARRTIRADGVARYAAACLLIGYGWLMVSGVAAALPALGVVPAEPWHRDLALHALALGFVISMVMGHAPLIVPAIARRRFAFGPRFYAPLALLHGSLLLRFVPAVVPGLVGDAAPTLRAVGSTLNALALVIFAMMVVMALRARRS